MRLSLALSLASVFATTAVAQDVHVRVDPRGPGSAASLTDFITIQQALDHAPEAKPNGRVIISIAPGIYRERVVVTRNRPRITLIGLGKSPADVVITASQNAASAGGTFLSATAEIDGDEFEADNVTFQNDAPPPTSAGGQAVAAAVRSDRAIFKHCRFVSDQDTLFADFGRQYYLDSFIAGGVDFIFGNATAVFDHDEIHEVRPAYLTAQSRTDPTQTTGYVITNSKVTRSKCLRDAPECSAPWEGTFYLGRPWRLYSRVIVMHTELPASLNPEGWSIWHKGDEMPPKAYYAEFQNTGPGADTSKRAAWSHQLTPTEAAQYTPATFLAGADHWNAVAEAARLPDPPVQLTAEQDHQRMLDLLHIASLRPGVGGSLNSPHPANYDETKANPSPSLPDPLTLSDGKKVTSAAEWTKLRRPELEHLFSDDVFGRVPPNVPAVVWHVASVEHETIGETPVITKRLVGHVDNSAYPLLDVDIDLVLTTPANATYPVPVVMEFTFESDPLKPAPMPVTLSSASAPAPKPPPPIEHPTWKEQVMARGWGFALLYPKSFQADNGAGLTAGIIGLVNHGQPRNADDWGALRAWAWGAGRVLDYLATDRAVDAKRVAMEGHSRFGKTALVAMAFDTRFAAAYISSSGAGGAALARHRFGEELENVAGPGEYHWMGGNYIRYAGPLTPADMPVDTHELIALCAPRPVFIGGGVTDGDGWADTRGAFLAEVAAGPVYRLLGAHDLGTDSYPPVGTALLSGDLAFRQHNGGHTPLPNFPYFLDFASRYLNQP
jgi:pectin methylesterase-like acyl-CoA thioesterase